MLVYNRNVLRLIQMAYRGQKGIAKKRGKSFTFTFKEWVEWWEKHQGSDWYLKRDAERGKYVMARKKDEGGYEEGNVKCILHEDNGREMAENGSSPWGERNGRGVLTEQDVIDIFYSDDTQVNIAARYGVTDSNVRCIRNRKSWKHITRDLTPRKFSSDKRKKLTDKEVRAIFLMKGEQKAIAEKYDISEGTVSEIKHRKKHVKATLGL